MNAASPNQSRSSATRWLTVIVATFVVTAFFTAGRTGRPLLINTLLFAGTASLASLPAGTFLALYAFRTQLPGRRIIWFLTVAMVFLPGYLQLTGWQAGFGMQGWFCRWWFPDSASAVLSGWRGAIWVQHCLNIPWIALFLGTSLQTLPGDSEVIASLHGTSWQVIRRVTLPQLRSAMVAALLWVFVLAASDITVTDVYQIRTFAEEIYAGFALGDSLSDAASRNIAGMLVITGSAFATWHVLQKATTVLTTLQTERHWSIRFRTPSTQQMTIACAAFIVLTTLGLPLCSLIYQAGLHVTASNGARVRSWSITTLAENTALSPMEYGEEFAWSFTLGQIATLTVLFVSLIVRAGSRQPRWLTWTAWLVAIAGLAIPGPILALSMSRIVNQPSIPGFTTLYDRTLFVPWLTLSIRLFPFALILVNLMLRRVSTNLQDVVALSGASRWQILRRVFLPLLATPLIECWLIIFALSLGDLSSTILALPPGITTLSVRIFNLVHYGVQNKLAGLCLSVSLLFTLLVWVVYAFRPTSDGER